MKRKLSSGILAFILIFTMTVPTFAANCRTPSLRNEALWQLLTRSGCCGGQQTGNELNSFLRIWLAQQLVSGDEPAQKEQDEAAKPPQPETAPDAPSSDSEMPPEPEHPQDSAGAGDGEAQQESPTRAYEHEVVRLVNLEREKAGLAALREDAALSDVARAKSQDMHDLGYFDHNSPTYGTPFQMMRSFGVSYRTAGENIAMGYRTPAAVVDAWMASPGHRANILNASYTIIGVGYVADGHYWTQHFIG